MRIFVTGATGFIGTELVKELIATGNQVTGLSRSEPGIEQLKAAGAEAIHGTIQDLDLLRKSAAGMDAVVHLAFNHDDMTKFAQSGADERAAIEALGSALAPGALLVVTSGTGFAQGGPGRLGMETDQPQVNANIPRQPESAARAHAERGVRVAIVRLPQVHDTRKQGLVPYLTETARQKRVSAYIGEGANRWAAAPLADVARLYRLVVEQTGPGVTIYHAVQEEGVPMREIAETIGKGFGIPVVSLTPEAAAEHFSWLYHFAALDMPASSAATRKLLNWDPTGPSLLEDLSDMTYPALA